MLLRGRVKTKFCWNIGESRHSGFTFPFLQHCRAGGWRTLFPVAGGPASGGAAGEDQGADADGQEAQGAGGLPKIRAETLR